MASSHPHPLLKLDVASKVSPWCRGTGMGVGDGLDYQLLELLPRGVPWTLRLSEGAPYPWPHPTPTPVPPHQGNTLLSPACPTRPIGPPWCDGHSSSFQTSTVAGLKVRDGSTARRANTLVVGLLLHMALHPLRLQSSPAGCEIPVSGAARTHASLPPSAPAPHLQGV